MPISRRSVSRLVVVPLAAAVVAVGVVLPSASAVVPAAQYSSTVVVRGELPSGFGQGRTNCDADPVLDFVEGPGTAPLGRGSLSVSASPGVGYARIDLPVYGVVAQQLGVRADHSVTSPASPNPLPDSGYGSIVIVVRTAPDVLTYVSVKGGAAQQGWQALDLWSGPITAVSIDQNTFTSTPLDVTAYGLFVATYPTAVVVGGYLGTSCLAEAVVAWDDVRVRVGGVETAYDLEPSVPAALTSAVSSTAVTYGGAASVTGAITRTGDASAVAGAEVELWRKTASAADFSYATTVTSSAGGGLAATVRPTAATQYRWQLPSASSFSGSASTARTVSVRAAVSLNRLSTSVAYPSPVVLWGTTRPSLAGTTVTLRRTGSSTALATATVRSDGTFAFSRKLSRGSYSFYVTVPATTSYLGATSSTLAVTVR